MAEQILESVRSKYGAVAESSLSSGNAGVRAVAEAFGYTPEELTSIPAEANMGLSCGNPTATAHIKQGEVVVDLGSFGVKQSSTCLLCALSQRLPHCDDVGISTSAAPGPYHLSSFVGQRPDERDPLSFR